MGDKFPLRKIEALLVACYRCCCICHRFCGVKIEIDHIVPRDDGGPSTIDNAIAVCFECHAEIHSYNDKHPRGRKFHPSELRKHKEQWLQLCKDRPEMIVAKRLEDVGPLQSLIDELEFNSGVAAVLSYKEHGCPFLDDQFLRAIREGAIATIRDDLKQSIMQAYYAIRRANQHIIAAAAQPPGPEPWAAATSRATESIIASREPIRRAREELLKFLGTET